MKLFMIIVLILIILTTNGLAWWGSEVDTVEMLYPNSNLKEQFQTVFWGGNETTYKHGFYRSWYENGQLEWDGQYVKDNKVGTWVKWDSTGYRIEEVTYLDGFKHGTEIEWNQNGTVRKRLHYRNGKLHGLCSWRKANYSINELFNNPNLTLEREGFYLDGVLIVTTKKKDSREYEFSCSDLLSPFYNPDLDTWVEWKQGECAFFVGRKVDGKKQGPWILWTETGDMKKTEYYDMDIPLK